MPSLLSLLPSPPPSFSPVLRGPSWPTAEDPSWSFFSSHAWPPKKPILALPRAGFRHWSPLCLQFSPHTTPSHVPRVALIRVPSRLGMFLPLLPSAPSFVAAFVPSPPPSASPVLCGPSWPTAGSLDPVWRIPLDLLFAVVDCARPLSHTSRFQFLRSLIGSARLLSGLVVRTSPFPILVQACPLPISL